MSSTLLAMKELLVKSGITDKTDNQAGKKSSSKEKEGKGKVMSDARSETMVYENALNKVTEENDQIVDSEITFCIRESSNQDEQLNKRESSSSEDRIDTSDELLEVELNDNFIADCAAEAVVNNRKQSYSEEKQDNP